MVKIEGDRFDIEEFPRWFPDGEVRAVEIDGDVFLECERFEQLSDHTEVFAAALGELNDLFAIMSLLVPNVARPQIATIIREHDDGSHDNFLQLSGTMSARSKMYATAGIVGEGQGAGKRTQAQDLLAGLGVDSHLDLAVSLWADPERTWPRLYRIMEEIERYLGRSIVEAGFCSDNQRERFTRSANNPAIAGRDARHARPFIPPQKPMDLTEARMFVSNLLSRALRDAASPVDPAERQ